SLLMFGTASATFSVFAIWDSGVISDGGGASS
ncbi:hypothetical protein A2U01_0091333, partial [Trifolium medium]|nr:hypothetical protein [Trifolium medium]